MKSSTLTRTSERAAIPDACDTHVHVFDPAGHAYDPARAYTPAEASCNELEALMRRLGTSRCVIVQPSVYGSDNSCLLAALKHFGPHRARGVAVIGATTPDAEIEHLKESGVRAVRVNFEAARSAAPADKLAVIKATIERVRQTGLAVQLYVDTATAAAACEAVAGTGVPLILDHFAGYKCGMDVGHETFQRLLNVLRSGNVWVKLSAPCRTDSSLHDYEDLRPAAQALIDAAPDRMVWASDWPHTGGGGSRSDRNPSDIEPFRQVDDLSDLQRLQSWIGDDGLNARIFANNAARIFDFSTKS